MVASCGPLEIVRLAAWFGLVTGFCESATHAIKRLALGKVLFKNYDIFWLASATDLVLFTILGLVAAVVVYPFVRLRALWATVFGFSALDFISQRFASCKIREIVWLLFVAGLANLFTRLIVRYSYGFRRRVVKKLRRRQSAFVFRF